MDYRPIACSLHDHLEAWAVRREPCRIVARDAAGGRVDTTARIVDLFARGGVEYLRTEAGDELRLDRVERVNHVLFPGASDA